MVAVMFRISSYRFFYRSMIESHLFSFVRLHTRRLPYAVLFSILAGAACHVHAQETRQQEWAVPLEKSSNLYRMTPTLFRSARVRGKDIALLQSLGIKTVVSFRSFHSDEAILGNRGFKLKRVSINTWDIDDKKVVAALRAIRAAEKNGPVLLHCLHGADRTGLISAMYRMVYQDWSKEQASDELMNGGYGYHSMWKNIPAYIREVDVEKIRAEVERD